MTSQISVISGMLIELWVSTWNIECRYGIWDIYKEAHNIDRYCHPGYRYGTSCHCGLRLWVARGGARVRGWGGKGAMSGTRHVD